MGAQVVSHRRAPGASNIESPIEISCTDESCVGEVEVETDVLRRASQRQLERFLKGPIPLHQISTAARLPGRALAVLLAVHHRTAITGQSEVTLPSGLLSEFGVDRHAKSRALRELEGAGLLHVERSCGRGCRVRLS